MWCAVPLSRWLIKHESFNFFFYFEMRVFRCDSLNKHFTFVSLSFAMHTARTLQIMLTCDPTIRYGRMGKTEQFWQKGPVLFWALNWKKQQIVLVMTSSYRHRFKPGTSGLWQSARNRSIAPLDPSKAARRFSLPVGRLWEFSFDYPVYN